MGLKFGFIELSDVENRIFESLKQRGIKVISFLVQRMCGSDRQDERLRLPRV